MAHHGAWERCDDAALLRAIVARDDAAFAVFYRRHLPRVLAYLLRETGDRETTADLAAEVFAAVMLAAGRYRPESETAAPWVIGIARNTLGTSRRRGRVEARARRRLRYQPVALEDPDLERVEAIADAGTAPLADLLDALPPGEREALVERVVHERGYAEIASDLACSEMVVRKRVSRGLIRLRGQIEKER